MTTFARRTNRLWLLSRVLIVTLAALPVAQQASGSTPYGLPSLPAMGEIMGTMEPEERMAGTFLCIIERDANLLVAFFLFRFVIVL